MRLAGNVIGEKDTSTFGIDAFHPTLHGGDGGIHGTLVFALECRSDWLLAERITMAKLAVVTLASVSTRRCCVIMIVEGWFGVQVEYVSRSSHVVICSFVCHLAFLRSSSSLG